MYRKLICSIIIVIQAILIFVTVSEINRYSILISVLQDEIQYSQEYIQQINTDHSGGAETQLVQMDTDSEYMFPISTEDYYISSPYGVRISPFFGIQLKHEGVDISSVPMSQIVAVKSGRIITHYPAPDGYYKGHDVYGGYIVIQHDDGTISRYAHLSRTYVHEGWRVYQGDVIGRMGNTGLSTGAHLHFELEIDNNTVNPLLYITNPLQPPEVQ